MKRTREELKQLQSLPLDVKIAKSSLRIEEFIDGLGDCNLYISFSGGKDSTVLVDIIHNKLGYKDIPLVFVDVPTQYPQLKDFVQANYDNVTIVKPSISFIEVCKKYGFPLVSKEVSLCVSGAKLYIQNNKNKSLYDRVMGNGCYSNNGKRRDYSLVKYKPLLNAPFDVSHECCNVMKKKPVKEYERKTGRKAFVGTMAEESKLREKTWINHGCNSFDASRVISQPLMFWTEQDILKYIHDNKLNICSVYGEVKVDENGKYYTTGCDRTGCVMCGFGCHLEKEPNRFQKLAESHPSYLKLLDICKNSDVTMREAIEWCNEHINRFHIELPPKVDE